MGFHLLGFIPVDEPQTNNKGVVLATIELFPCLPLPLAKLLIATTSDYVCSGIQGPGF